MFGNIFASPYMKLYFFVQNSSYEHLNSLRSKRSLVNLHDGQEQLLKAKVISALALSDNRSKAALRIEENAEKKIEIECVKIFKGERLVLLL